MRIGELSQRTGISTSRIRFYEKHKVLPQPSRNGNSLSEIRAGLSEAAPNFPSREALVKALRSKLDHIDQHINEVRARRRQIEKLLKEMGD